MYDAARYYPQGGPFEGPFNDDIYLQNTVDTLIQAFGVQGAIETGTWRFGNTTKFLAERVKQVATIEFLEDNAKAAAENLAGVENITQYVGSSPEVLARIIPYFPRPTLYFLDAHLGRNAPLKDEIRIIGMNDPQPIIVIHDFEVPGYPELGYENDGMGHDYNIAWINDVLLFRHPWHYFYNSQATGAKRGVLFIVPKVMS